MYAATRLNAIHSARAQAAVPKYINRLPAGSVPDEELWISSCVVVISWCRATHRLKTSVVSVLAQPDAPHNLCLIENSWSHFDDGKANYKLIPSFVILLRPSRQYGEMSRTSFSFDLVGECIIGRSNGSSIKDASTALGRSVLQNDLLVPHSS